MSFGISDIKAGFDLFNYIKQKFFAGTNWQNESLKQDIMGYFKEFYCDLKQADGGRYEIDDSGKELLGNAYDELKRLDLLDKNDFNPEDFDNSYLEKCFKHYMKEGDYRKVMQGFRIKMNSYGTVIKECIENYGNADGKKVKKERLLFNDFFSQNLIDLKQGYLDFLLVSFFPKRLDSNSRKYIIYETVEKVNFEKYIPIVNKFLDKIENRII